jgi:hypothetical protein
MRPAVTRSHRDNNRPCSPRNRAPLGPSATAQHARNELPPISIVTTLAGWGWPTATRSVDLVASRSLEKYIDASTSTVRVRLHEERKLLRYVLNRSSTAGGIPAARL